jgi:HSP20 family molecular chaperone IbpA
MQVKGLKEIKTSTGRQSRSVKIEIRNISSLAGRRPVPTHTTKVSEPRTWVFISEPKFSRIHQSLLVNKTQEPTTEIFTEAESVIVIADIPGVIGEENIQLGVEGDILIIEATSSTLTGTRKYLKEVVLPFQVDPANILLAFNNGLMEVKLIPVHSEVKK